MIPLLSLALLALALASAWHGYPWGAASFGMATGLSAALHLGAGDRGGAG